MGDGRGDLQRAWHTFAGGFFEGKTILDVGAGIGLSRERLSRGGRNRVTLQDIDRSLLRDVDLIRDVRDVEGRWDVVVSFDVVEHVPDARAFLRELWRLAGDAVLFTTPAHRLYPHPWHFTPGEIVGLVEGIPPATIDYFARYKSGDSDDVRAVDRATFFDDETIYAHGLWIGKSSTPRRMK